MRKLAEYSLSTDTLKNMANIKPFQKAFWHVTVWVIALDDQGEEFKDETTLIPTKRCKLSAMLESTQIAFDKIYEEHPACIDIGFTVRKRR